MIARSRRPYDREVALRRPRSVGATQMRHLATLAQAGKVDFDVVASVEAALAEPKHTLQAPARLSWRRQLVLPAGGKALLLRRLPAGRGGRGGRSARPL